MGDRELVAGEREFRPGDRVACRQNDSALKVCNGTRATVRGVEPVLGIVTLLLDGGPIRQVHSRYAAEHLEHGYALTGHAAQGLSSDRAFVLVRAEGAIAEWGHVVASRARGGTRRYAVGPGLVDNAGLVRNDPEPAMHRIAGALTRAAAEPPAVGRVEGGSEGPGPVQMARERLQREIESRGRPLASTRQQLGSLGWIGRRRHGPALREAINGQMRVLASPIGTPAPPCFRASPPAAAARPFVGSPSSPTLHPGSRSSAG